MKEKSNTEKRKAALAHAVMGNLFLWLSRFPLTPPPRGCTRWFPFSAGKVKKERSSKSVFCRVRSHEFAGCPAAPSHSPRWAPHHGDVSPAEQPALRIPRRRLGCTRLLSEQAQGLVACPVFLCHV